MGGAIVPFAFGLSYAVAGLVTAWTALVGASLVAEGRRAKVQLALQVAALAAVATLAIAGGIGTVVVAFR